MEPFRALLPEFKKAEAFLRPMEPVAPEIPREMSGQARAATVALAGLVMWINRDVDLPQALVTAQGEGRLVIFAGAGVSMGPPSNLPAFDALADAVAEGVIPRKDGETLDAFLGRVEQQGVNVQARTRALIVGSQNLGTLS